MACTIKRKSVRKSSKKNVQIRKRGKSRKTIKNMRGGGGGVILTKNLISNILVEIHGNNNTLTKMDFWHTHVDNSYNYINEIQEFYNKKFTRNQIKHFLDERQKKENTNYYESQGFNNRRRDRRNILSKIYTSS